MNSFNIGTLRHFLRELKEKDAKIHAQIQHTEGLIEALGDKRSKRADDTENTELQQTVAEVFAQSENKELKLATIIEHIQKKHQIETGKLRGKLIYLTRTGFLENTGTYGKYKLGSRSNNSDAYLSEDQNQKQA